MKLMGLHCLTDIHHQARGAGDDAQHGDRTKEEAPAPSFVPPESKIEIIEACSRGDPIIRQVARDVDLTAMAAR